VNPLKAGEKKKKGWCVQVPVVDFGQEKNPSEVEVVSEVIEELYFVILPTRLEIQFLRPVLVFVRVFHSWSL
jgi:hypothetical protein